MHLMERLFRDKTEEIRLSRPGNVAPEISEVAVDMADIARQIERQDLELEEAHAFMRSQRFQQNFRLQGEKVYRVV